MRAAPPANGTSSRTTKRETPTTDPEGDLVHEEESGIGLHREVADRLALSYDYELWRPHRAALARLMEDLQLRYVQTERWSTDVDDLESLLPHAVGYGRFRWGYEALVDLESETGCRALLTLDDGVVDVYLAGGCPEALAAGRAYLQERLPERDRDVDRRVAITFWCYGSCGATCSSRTVAVPTWGDIQRNYTQSVAAKLETLMQFEPAAGGQLVLWHGPPGTGKTYALRALGWEWRRWCDMHYIVDPESFFGRSDYMMEVLLEDDGDEDRWRLLVLEDTGELLSVDAKAESGQGLSRFLNLVDGLIGQGVRVLVLVTTNEHLRSLHPAVARPGRCAERIEFRGLDTEEAASWLCGNVLESKAGGGTLAELFARAEGREPDKQAGVGFHV
jgi:ATPase family associated with various cellular activities (AAA)